MGRIPWPVKDWMSNVKSIFRFSVFLKTKPMNHMVLNVSLKHAKLCQLSITLQVEINLLFGLDGIELFRVDMRQRNVVIAFQR